MTLTAMMSAGQLVNPSAEVAEGSDWAIVARRIRDLQNDEGLYCPHCHRALAQLAPVRLRAGSTRILHFFHLQLEGEQRECKNFSGESEKHMAAKTRLYEHLQRVNPLQIASIYLDSTVLKTQNISDRKPDVLVLYKNGSRVAHEIQISPISSTALLERSRDLKQHGCIVRWYLYGNVYSRENRQALAAEGIECYRLVFEDSDPARPVWTLDPGLEPEQPKQRQPMRDRCQESSSSRITRQEDLRAERYQRSVERHPHDALTPEDEPLDDYGTGINEPIDGLRQLCAWFLISHAQKSLPIPPFALTSWITVNHPDFYSVINGEVTAALEFLDGTRAKRHPRHQSGGLENTLCHLKTYCDGGLAHAA